MRALLVKQLSSDFSGLAFVELPRPVAAPGEALIRLKATALNFPDLLMTQGLYQHKPELPFSPGMEAAGVIETPPPGSAFKVGDGVMVGLRAGGLMDYVTAPIASLRAMPPRFDYAEAAGFTTAYLTAYVALVRRAALQPGETLLVHGAGGGVGLAAVELGRHLGAQVIATASSDQKRAVAAAKGAHHVLAPSGFREAVKELTGGRGADVIYDPVGGDVFDESVRAIAWGGRLLVVGFTSGRIPALSANMALIKGFSLIGVRAGEYGRREPEKGRENIMAIDRLAAEGKLRPHIGARLPFARAIEGLRMLQERRAIGKIVIEFE